ncbi:MAG: DUF3160 domain-containing protein [Planctomycetota bacterium]|nr:DUF3160 domain-containing protein [Planctomycetota bacterium]
MQIAAGTVLCYIALSCPQTRAEDKPPPAGEPQATSLTFDPLQAKYLDRIRGQLALTDAEWELFRRQGFVSVDQARDYNFGTAYRHIYGRDLPVLITTDSILHIVHRSFDNMLAELEEGLLSARLEEVLGAVHAELGRRPAAGPWDQNVRDVELFIAVARSLLAGQAIPSVAGQDTEVAELLRLVASLHMQDPLLGEKTAIFGGQRAMDFSRYKPRGHYTKSSRLQNYYRCVMWLGAADTAWYLSPPHPDSGLVSNGLRELRNALLFVDVVSAVGRLEQLGKIERAIDLLIGAAGDNLLPRELRRLMDEAGVRTLADLTEAAEGKLRAAVEQATFGRRRIRSQVLFDGRFGTPIEPPAMFQVLGQVFAVDSYVMSHVVYDSVPRRDDVYRSLPHGLDVMAALGNRDARELLADELARFAYHPQLAAATQAVNEHLREMSSTRSLYDQWLSTLRTLHSPPEGSDQGKYFPQVMRSPAWRKKQLQTQLASWAELRHDIGILYANLRQSYTTRKMECDYPAGYVEPYPEFYAQLRRFAERVGDVHGEIRGLSDGNGEPRRHVFWQRTSQLLSSLETLAAKELRGEAFTSAEEAFLKETVHIRTETKEVCGKGTGVTKTFYTGWYCDLFYPNPANNIDRFVPTVADVHTDTNNGGRVLEVGVGHATLGVIAIDNGADVMAYVGPLYTYYEFTQPVGDRLTDEQFSAMIFSDRTPPRPAWVSSVQPAPAQRAPQVP